MGDWLLLSQRPERFSSDLGIFLLNWEGKVSGLTSPEVRIATCTQDRHETRLQGSFVSTGRVCYFLQNPGPGKDLGGKTQESLGYCSRSCL